MSDDPWLVFAITALAVFRLSWMVANDTGPWAVFLRLREAAPAGLLREWLGCPFCLAVTFAAAATCWLWWSGLLDPQFAPVWWLGTAGAASVICRWFSDR